MKTITKAIALVASLLLYNIATAQQVAKTIPNTSSPDGLIGFLEFKPADYGSQKHPLIIFLHGIGERGNGTSQIMSVTANAIPMYCAQGASMRFTVGSQTSSFVVLSPQLCSQYGYWPTFYVKEMIKYAKANLQIDTNRIYVTGLSLGGGGIWRMITDTQNFDHSFDGTIAAAAPVCGTQEENDYDFCSTIGTNHLPVWAFHSMDDGTVGVGATQHAEILGNICGNFSPAMKFTYYQTGGHYGAWLHAFDTGHITTTVNVNGSTTSFTANPNLYEWFLSKTRAIAPVADAGPSQTISATSTVLNAAGSYSPNGSITSYNWQQVSGPAAATIVNAGSPTATISNMLLGSSYSFKLTVTDVVGASGSAVTGVTVVNTLLPVTFTYFKVQSMVTGNMLQWETAIEKNNAYFGIERSTDGTSFTSVDRVPGHETDNAVSAYSYMDARPPAVNAWYRLRQVDKDGQSSLSKVIQVKAYTQTPSFEMYPNPVQDKLAISLHNNNTGNVKVCLYDLAGHAVVEETKAKTNQPFNTIINMNQLQPGIYIVEMKLGNDKMTRRVLKR